MDDLNTKFYGIAYVMASGRDSHMWDGKTCCTYFNEVHTTVYICEDRFCAPVLHQLLRFNVCKC